ncbi:MAG: PTS sugar transporter subunit IIA [Candidatus Eisenbacteria bacterium]
MKISSMVVPERIIDLKSRTKNEVLRELFRVLEKAPEITDGKDLEQSIIERENVLTTGIGFEIAIPHVQLHSVSNFVMAIGRCEEGIDFDSLDGKPVRLVIMIASSDKQARNEFLKVLGKAVLLFKDESFRKKVLRASTPEQVMAVLRGS